VKLLGIIIAILCFIILVIGHEFGHFSVAKLLGIRVNEFSVGMGPLAFQKQKGETKYSIRWIPIGGYCALEGEDGNSDDPRAFSKQPAWAKILVLVAGAFMNIVLGLIVFTLIFSKTGVAIPKISSLVENGPAQVAGIKEGDVIVAVDDEYYSDFTSIQGAIAYGTGETIKITVERDSAEQSFDIVPVYNETTGTRQVGIVATISHSIPDSLNAGIKESAVVLLSIKDFFTGLFNGNTSVNDVSGVVGIVSLAGQAAEFGLINVFYLMALISVNLGYMNLIPFPALDGGRILMTLIRAIFKGKISDEAEGVVHAVGLVILLILMVIILLKDTIGLFK